MQGFTALSCVGLSAWFRITSTVHALIAGTAGFTAIVFGNGDLIQEPFHAYSTFAKMTTYVTVVRAPTHNATCVCSRLSLPAACCALHCTLLLDRCVSVGYFFADLVVIVKHFWVMATPLENAMYMLHHVLGAVGMSINVVRFRSAPLSSCLPRKLACLVLFCPVGGAWCAEPTLDSLVFVGWRSQYISSALWFAMFKLMTELSTPFVSCHMMLTSNKPPTPEIQRSPLYLVNGICLVLMFLSVRIIALPVYWYEAVLHREALYTYHWALQALFLFTSVTVDVMNIMWFSGVVIGAKKYPPTWRPWRVRDKKKQ